ncbi:MAG: hypothetical protein Q9186_003728 [Xanthomendoza sp. 1 TL-2023]
MEWLSPVVLPRPTKGLDPVLRLLEDEERVKRIQGSSTHRRALEHTITGVRTEDEVYVAAGQLLQVAIEALEEGEISEDAPATSGASQWTAINNNIDPDLDSQDLPPMNITKGGHKFTPLVALSEIRGTATIPTCPHCRQPANINNRSCHADSLQLIRVRLRITNLAYQCFGFAPNAQETIERQELQHFLHRRFLDNIFLSPEPIPTPSNCRRIFKQARLILRDEVHRYWKQHDLSSHEHIPVMQLAMFYENFKLRDEHIHWFFNPDARLDLSWDFQVSDTDVRLLNQDPRVYCSRLTIFASSLVYAPPTVRIVRDEGAKEEGKALEERKGLEEEQGGRLFCLGELTADDGMEDALMSE